MLWVMAPEVAAAAGPDLDSITFEAWPTEAPGAMTGGWEPDPGEKS